MAINGFGQNGNFFQSQINPNAYAARYAKQKGISIDEAKNELRSSHGEPKFQQKVGLKSGFKSNDNDKPDVITLMGLGIPMNIIQQGDNAIKNYAEENNINLPEKRRLNFSA